MSIKLGKVEGIPFHEAAWTGGVITPRIVVLHDTASRLDHGNAAAYLRSKNAGKVSVHFVVERDGSVEQQVRTDRRANHAGKSHYHGESGCNGFAIGIEIVNPGKMEHRGEKARAWWGEEFKIKSSPQRSPQDVAPVMRIVARKTPQHGAGVWMDYTPAQIEAVTNLLQTLFADIPTLIDIVPHWYVSPGRKVDTNPLFPLDHVRAVVMGREEPADEEAEARADPVSDEMAFVDVSADDDLNMRRWPSFNPNVIAAIPSGATVPVLARGTFGGREWLKVRYGPNEGWVVARYTAAIEHQRKAKP